MAKILHISDLHVGRTETEGRNLKGIVKYIVNRDWNGLKPIVLITGDIVNDGEEEQFVFARKLLNDLYTNNFTVLPIPGNHDYGKNGNHAQEKRFKYFKNEFYKLENVSYPHVKEINGHYFIGLNSMSAETGFFEGLLANGELGSKQIKNTLGVLKKLDGRPPEQKVILHLHHHPFVYPDEGPLKRIGDKVGHGLEDGDDLLHKISGRVDILLFGHEHRHLNFSRTKLSEKYRIPHIISSGKSTELCTEYAVNGEGEAVMADILNTGLLGRIIEIDDHGKCTIDTIKFPNL